MSSATEGDRTPSHPGLLSSIKGKIALANLASVLVLLVVAVVASLQFLELGKVLSAVSDGAEVLMRLSHAYDEREQLLTSFRRGYADPAQPNGDARVRFAAVADDLQLHARKARQKLAGGNGAALLSKAEAGIEGARRRAERVDRLPPDNRESAVIEIEESLADALGQLAEAKLDASRAMAGRLAGVQHELQKPARLFWLAAALGGVIALGISFFLRARVSKPIEKLSLAVAALARGEPKPVPVVGHDELARLGTAFNSMAQTITERSRSLRLVLDNVGDGLVTSDLSGLVVGEPSRNALAWFGPAAAGAPVASYLFSLDEELRAWFVLGFEQLASGVLSFEEGAAQIPKEFRCGERIFALALRPVLVDDELARVLLVISDMTERRLLAHKEREARDVYHLATVALREPDAFTEFVTDTNKRLARVAAEDDILLELHTIKGNAGVMGCAYFSSKVHDAESRQVERILSAQDVADLTTHWRELVESAEIAVGRTVNSALVIPRSDYERLCQLLAARREQEAQLLARSWSMQRMDSVFQRLSRSAEQYAARVGKRVLVDSDHGALVVPRGPLDELWSCLVHLVKNTIAHGVEREAGRLERGKPAQGRVSLHAAAKGGQLSVTVRDDGAGIDWEALGVADLDGARQLDALTRSGSSAREVSEVAGRGVGLSAVRKVVEGLGGRVLVRSEKGRGTDVIATVPAPGMFHVTAGDVDARAWGQVP